MMKILRQIQLNRYKDDSLVGANCATNYPDKNSNVEGKCGGLHPNAWATWVQRDDCWVVDANGTDGR